MADTSVTYTGDAVLTTFSVPFPYLQQSHVKVKLNGINVLNPGVWYFSDASTIKFRNAPADGASVYIYRQTQGDTRLVNFQNGAVLTEADLDLSANQNFYLLQEAKENLTDLINGEIIRIGSGNGIVSVDPDEIIAGLVEQVLEDATALNLSQRVTDIDDNAASILSVSTNLQSQINALAQGIAAIVYVQAAEPVPGVGGVPDPIPDGARWYDSDDNNHPYIYDGTGVAWVDIADPRIANNASAITVLQADLTTAEGDISGNAGLISTLNATVYDGSTGVAANAAAISSLTATVGDNTSAITTEQSARADGDSALAADIALIGAANLTDTAFILDTSTVKIDSDGGDTFATRLSALSAADGTNAANITSEESARITADGVIADELHLLGAQNGAATAFILDTATVKLDSDAGVTMASKFSSIEATNSANSASITTIQSVTIPAIQSDVTGLEARYGVTLDVNGYITGFAQNNDGSTGTFVVLADKFAVVKPGETAVTPFLVSGGVVTMQDVVISGSLVVDGTIDSQQLATKSASELILGTFQSSIQILTEGSWTEVDTEDVTLEAGDTVELWSSFTFLNQSPGVSGQLQFRWRRFDGVTADGIVGGPLTKIHDGSLSADSYDKDWTEELNRFDQPGAGDWTYKFEIFIPSAMSGTYYVQNYQHALKVFKKSTT